MNTLSLSPTSPSGGRSAVTASKLLEKGQIVFDQIAKVPYWRSAYANFAIQEASCLINLGGRFDDRTTGVIASYAPVARAASPFSLALPLLSHDGSQMLAKFMEKYMFGSKF